MSAICKLLGFFIFAGVVPVLSGMLPLSLFPGERRSFRLLILAGYLSAFALFELVGIPVLLLTPMGDFRLLAVLYTVLLAVWILCGALRLHGKGGMESAFLRAVRARFSRKRTDAAGEGRRTPDPEVLFFRIVFFAVLGFQLYKAYTMASYDGDDAYYVAQSVQAVQTGTMYHYIPYTGVTTVLDWRHALAMLPMWIAWVSTLCATHPTIVTHSMLPLVFLPLADAAAYSVLRELLDAGGQDKTWESDSDALSAAAMVLVEVLQIFGNLSIYTPESFLLLRTWQGKTVFVAVLVPAAFALLLQLGHSMEKGERTGGCAVLLLLLNLSSCLCTSMAPFLILGLLLPGSLFLAVLYRKPKIIVTILLACIPNLVTGAVLFRQIQKVYFWQWFLGGK